jgi:exonuclease III
MMSLMLRGKSQPISDLSSDLTEGISTRAGSSCHPRIELVEDKQGEPFNSRSDEEGVIFADTEELCGGKTLAERVGEDQHRVDAADLTDSVVVRQDERVKARKYRWGTSGNVFALNVPGGSYERVKDAFGYCVVVHDKLPIPEFHRFLQMNIKWKSEWGPWPLIKVTRKTLKKKKHVNKAVVFTAIFSSAKYHFLVVEMNRICQENYVRGATRKVWHRYRPEKGSPVNKDPLEGIGVIRADEEPFRVASWNVNGLREKISEVHKLMFDVGSGALCIQETLRRPSFWALKLNNWTVQTVFRSDQPGARGVSLAVSPEFSTASLAVDSQNIVSTKVFGGNLKAEIGVVGVYIPCRLGRKSALVKLAKTLTEIIKLNPTLPIILVGDFNTKPKQLKRWLTKVGLGMVRIESDQKTWMSADVNRKPSIIDHIVATSELAGFIKMKVMDEYTAVSDHAALLATVELENVVNTVELGDSFQDFDPGPKFIYSWEKGANVSKVRNDNRWLPLLTIPEDEPIFLDALALSFSDVSEEVAAQHGFGAEKEEKTGWRGNGNLSKKVLRLMSHRRKARECLLREIRNKGTELAIQAAKLEFDRLKKETSKVAMWERRNRWFQAIHKICAQKSTRGIWRWVKSMSKTSSGLKIAPVLRKDTGQLETNCDAIIKNWWKHYEDLSADESGSSKNRSFWEEKFPNIKEVLEPEALNALPLWPEICGTMKDHMKKGKAPGFDNITQEWLNIACDEKDPESGEYPAKPESPMGEVMLRLFQMCWSLSRVPQQWQTGLLVSIFKKGDPASMDNYRGITLMSLGLKVMCCLVTRRLVTAIESKKVLVKAQGGFRPSEEAIAQATTLYEVLLRRLIQGKKTYVAFLDLKKAFDTVPHEALFAKLRAIGVKGKILELIETIYDSSQFRVRIGGKFTDLIKLLRGVRQGCPASPTLFDIFINDILDGTENFGVSVPGLPKRIDGGPQRLSGLMFADDLVALAPSHRNLDRILQRIGAWSTKNGMRFGISKCAILHFMRKRKEREAAKKGNPPILLCEEAVPVDSVYTYLGLEFNDELDLGKMVNARVKVMEKKLMSIGPFLRSKCIPLPIRTMVLRGLPVAVGRYGMELFGMKRALTNKLETLTSKGLKWIAGISTRRRVNLTSLRVELGISSMAVSAAKARSRLLVKTKDGGLKIWLTDLVEHPQKSRRQTWISGGIRWLKAWGPTLTKDQHEALRKSKAADGRLMSRYVGEHVKNREGANNTSTAWKFYCEHELEDSRDYLKWSFQNLELGRAYTALLQCRTGSFLTAQKLAQMKLIPKSSCLCCESKEDEDLFHMFFECEAHQGMRAEYLGTLVAKCHGDKNEQVAMLLGGTVGQFDLKIEEWSSAFVSPDSPEAGSSFSVDQLAAQLKELMPGPDSGIESEMRKIESQVKREEPVKKVAVPGAHLQVVRFLDGICKVRAPKLRKGEKEQLAVPIQPNGA